MSYITLQWITAHFKRKLLRHLDKRISETIFNLIDLLWHIIHARVWSSSTVNAERASFLSGFLLPFRQHFKIPQSLWGWWSLAGGAEQLHTHSNFKWVQSWRSSDELLLCLPLMNELNAHIDCCWVLPHALCCRRNHGALTELKTEVKHVL